MPHIELLGVEADRADHEPAASVLIPCQQARQRRAAITGNARRHPVQREPDGLLGLEHQGRPPGFGGADRDQERHGHLRRRTFPGGCFFAGAALEIGTRPGPVREAVAGFQAGFVDLLRGFAATAVERNELPADEDPGRLAFELNGIILATDANFVLHDDPAVLDLARQVVRRRLRLSTTAAPPDRKGRSPPRPCNRQQALARRRTAAGAGRAGDAVGTVGADGVPVFASRTIMNVPAGPLIVLTGPPGAGKTTVARLVAQALDPAVHLPADEFWRFIRTGYIAPWRAESQAQNAIVIDAVSSGAVIYAVGGYHVVMDGIIGPWFLNRLVARACPGHVDVHYVVLRPAQLVAARRILGRPEDELSGRHQAIEAERPDDPGAAARMYREFSALGRYEKHVIDSSAMSAKETAEVVQRLVATGQLRVGHR